MGKTAKKDVLKATTKRSGNLGQEVCAVDRRKLLFNQEAAILDTTELLCMLMKEAGVSRAELAARMGTTKGNITQILDGSRNMTIRTVSDVMTHLGHEYQASYKGRETKSQPCVVFRVAAEIQIPMNSGPVATPENIDFLPTGLANTMELSQLSIPPRHSVGV